MALESFASDKQKTKVGATGTELETYVQTAYERDSSNKIIPGTAKSTIYVNTSSFPGIPKFEAAAASKDGGKSWDVSSFKKSDGSTVLGADAQKSLKEGALKTSTNQQIQTSAEKAKLSPNDLKTVSSKASTEAEPTPQESQEALDKELSEARGRPSYSKTLRYPADLQLGHQDVMQFNMLKYEKRTLGTGENAGSFNERSNYESRTIGIVHLPIPAGISDTNAVTWGSDTLTATGKALADVANAFIGGGGDAAANEAGEKIEAISNYSEELKAALQPYFAGQAIGKANILSRTQGAIQNPNMELLFSGPTLRPFTFSFRLSARGQKDREQIRQIIRFFKQGMSVQRTPSQLFLKAPNTFKIRYLHGNKDHPYINLIKECALQSFTVNYTPDATYMTFADGLMTSYEINMQFQEIEPIFNDDYDNFEKQNKLGQDAVIGY